MERYRGLTEIKSYQEYQQAKERLKHYIEEYKWITSTNKPYEDIKAELDQIIGMREKEENPSKHTALETEGKAQALKVKFDAVQDKTYEPNLYRNIMALILTIENYEAKMSKSSFFATLVGAIAGKKEDMENLKKRYLFGRAVLTGDVYGEHNVQLESVDNILNFLGRNYEWVNLDPTSAVEENSTALAIIPQREEASPSKTFSEAMKRTNSLLEEIKNTPQKPPEPVKGGETSSEKTTKTSGPVINIRKAKSEKQQDSHDIQIDQ